MTLIITHRQDYTADFLIHKLNSQKLSYLRLNCEDIDELGYRCTNSDDFSFALGGHSAFHSVWYRRIKFPTFSGLTVTQAAYLHREYEALYANIFQQINCLRWLSKPSAVRNAESKLWQLHTATQLGFAVPQTLVTSSKAELERFADEVNDVVVKPLHSGRLQGGDEVGLIYTSRLAPEHLENIKDYDLSPVIFQRYIEKEYEIRVTVVGRDVYAARVDSQSNPVTETDWRKEKLPFTAYTLPDNTRRRCVALVEALELNFGAIDLIKSVDGSYYFLEINPNGQWAWIEMDTALPISDSIIKFLYE